MIDRRFWIGVAAAWAGIALAVMATNAAGVDVRPTAFDAYIGAFIGVSIGWVARGPDV